MKCSKCGAELILAFDKCADGRNVYTCPNHLFFRCVEASPAMVEVLKESGLLDRKPDKIILNNSEVEKGGE